MDEHRDRRVGATDMIKKAVEEIVRIEQERGFVAYSSRSAAEGEVWFRAYEGCEWSLYSVWAARASKKGIVYLQWSLLCGIGSAIGGRDGVVGGFSPDQRARYSDRDPEAMSLARVKSATHSGLVNGVHRFVSYRDTHWEELKREAVRSLGLVLEGDSWPSYIERLAPDVPRLLRCAGGEEDEIARVRQCLSREPLIDGSLIDAAYAGDEVETRRAGLFGVCGLVVQHRVIAPEEAIVAYEVGRFCLQNHRDLVRILAAMQRLVASLE